MSTETPAVTAKDILRAIRQKYHAAAVVSEVVIEDPLENAIYRRWLLDNSASRAYYAKTFASRALDVADSVPEGWSLSTASFIRRIDALMWKAPHLTAIEVKMSLADFRRDTDAKRRAWREHTHRFVYAAPKGLLTPDMIPEGCGLWEFDPSLTPRFAISATKNAVLNSEPTALPPHVFTSMLYRVSNHERNTAS